MVAIDSRSRRDGAAIEELGWYNPIDNNNSFSLKEDRIIHWLKEGAQPTDAAHKLLRKSGLSFHWHLIKQGLDEKQIEKEMKKWALNKEDAEKHKSKIAESTNVKEVVVKEEAPKEEAPKEEAPKEEPPKKEAPKEEAPKEEAPKEEAPKKVASKKRCS